MSLLILKQNNWWWWKCLKKMQSEVKPSKLGRKCHPKNVQKYANKNHVLQWPWKYWRGLRLNYHNLHIIIITSRQATDHIPKTRWKCSTERHRYKLFSLRNSLSHLHVPCLPYNSPVGLSVVNKKKERERDVKCVREEGRERLGVEMGSGGSESRWDSSVYKDLWLISKCTRKWKLWNAVTVPSDLKILIHALFNCTDVKIFSFSYPWPLFSQ